MSKIRLSLSTIRELDMGKMAKAFDVELEHVVKDCIDRPLDNRPREVVLRMTVTPDHSDGVCDLVSAEIEIRAKVPTRRSRKYQLAAHANGALLVNPDSPDDVSQMTIDEANR